MARSLYRLTAGAFTAFAVCMQYFLLMRGESGVALASASVKFFSFFTIICNLLAAAALLAPVLAPNTRAGRFLDRPTVRTAIAGYMIMVGIIYYALLVGLSEREGWSLVFEHLLHAVTPPLFVIDWLAFADKRMLDWRIALRGLIFPLGYAALTLARGAATGWYPYPFLDVGDLGYPSVLFNIAWLAAAFIALELVLVAAGRRLSIPRA